MIYPPVHKYEPDFGQGFPPSGWFAPFFRQHILTLEWRVEPLSDCASNEKYHVPAARCRGLIYIIMCNDIKRDKSDDDETTFQTY
jgi:hypothetical protein